MYREHFGLKELPFSIAPDPRYLYMSDKHQEALAHLLYGINSNGSFVLLTGEVGAGKTTLCRCLIEQIPENSDIAFILNPKLSAEELLAVICDELGIAYPEGTLSVKFFVDLINSYLLDAHARGRKTVVIIEEAQNLSTGVLEQVRLLTNLETNQEKLLQIIMVGQPELREMLEGTEMRQLSQRITARYHLGRLSKREVSSYVKHRLAVAGMHGRLFSPSAIGKVYRLSNGIPRLINLLCDRAMLGAYVQGRRLVDRPTIVKASREVIGEQRKGRQNSIFRWSLTGLVLTLCGVAIGTAFYSQMPRPRASMPQQRHNEKALELPVGLSPARSEDMASRALLGQWNIRYEDDVPLCSQARAYGLECLNGTGSIGRLLQLNRPAILKLFDAKGHEYFVTLTGVRGQKAEFVVGPEKRIADAGEIEMRWLGDYRMLWDPPADYEGEIRPHDRGPQIGWISRQMAVIQGRKTRQDNDLFYDNALVGEVKRFQLSKGLKPDGIVGPKTIAQLNAETSRAGPRLVRKQEEN
jgi:general secretion pathway protein A